MRRRDAAVISFMVACGDTGQERVEVALSAQGSSRSALELDAATIRLSRADVAFGPAYFCATESAEVDLCAVALLELRETVRIDGLSADVRQVARLEGTTGAVRSALYDYGLSWYLTQPAPHAAPAAPDGHSALLLGEVVAGERRLRFRAAIDVLPRARGDASMNAQRTSHQIKGQGEGLRVAIDPYRWFERVDIAELFALDDADDAPGDGQVEIAAGSQAYEAIVQGMQNRAPVRFVWE